MLILFLALLLSASIFWPQIRFSRVEPDQQAYTKNIKIIGHRGAAKLAPENTLAGFEKAVEVGADMVELDIHMTKDGEIVVIHDATLDRTTNGNGAIIEHNFSEIRTLDAGGWYDTTYSGQKVPTLREAMELINGRCQLLIEIKWPEKGIYESIVEKTVALVNEMGASHWVIIQSFEPQYLHQLTALGTNIEYHQLLYAYSNILPLYYDRSFHVGRFEPVEGVSSVNLHYKYLSEGTKHQFGVERVGVYTVNGVLDMGKVVSLGAEYLITDRPDLAIEAFRGK